MLDEIILDNEFSMIIEIVGEAFFDAHNNGFGLPVAQQYQLWKQGMEKTFKTYQELINEADKAHKIV